MHPTLIKSLRTIQSELLLLQVRVNSDMRLFDLTSEQKQTMSNIHSDIADTAYKVGEFILSDGDANGN